MPDIDNRTVDVHVSRLRKVLNDNYHGTCKIHTVHGFGYCIEIIDYLISSSDIGVISTDSPQPHAEVSFGLLNLNPALNFSST